MFWKQVFTDSISFWTAIGALATILAVIMALFGEKIKSKIWGARLFIEHKNKLPFNKHAYSINTNGQTKKGFYIRLKIENTGKSTAHSVYGKLTKIEYLEENQSIDIYDPSVLRWVSTQECKPINLSPRDFDFLDILFSIENEDNFILQTDYKLRGSPFVFKKNLSPHALYISIYSDDAPTVSARFSLQFDISQRYDSIKLQKL